MQKRRPYGLQMQNAEVVELAMRKPGWRCTVTEIYGRICYLGTKGKEGIRILLFAREMSRAF